MPEKALRPAKVLQKFGSILRRKMLLQSLTPILWVDDLAATTRYYSNVLGFTVRSPSEEGGWAPLLRDAAEIMFSIPNTHMPYVKPCPTGSLYYRTTEMDAWWQALKEKATIAYPLEDFEYGMREFAIIDCNGYMLQFGQELEPLFTQQF